MITVWGFANCSTVKKACKWLKERNIEFFLVDTKKYPPNIEILNDWQKQIGIESLLNKKSASWRLLKDEEKTSTNSSNICLSLMMEKTALIKRPIITSDKNGKNILVVGFDNDLYANLIHKQNVP